LKSWATNDAAKNAEKAEFEFGTVENAGEISRFSAGQNRFEGERQSESETKTFDSPNVVGIVEGAISN
jgi:hypothetical protein